MLAGLAAAFLIPAVVAVEQVYVECAGVTILSRTPKPCVTALGVEITIVVIVTGRDGREPEIIRAVATTIPTGCGREYFASN